ncbi:hypothetical protein HPB51_018505 [Rhipicephalus microplus]|uniref:Methyltransferase domain-containing protein n=1 Tax=Rhipicephalus microplus TaxID=6941 RepID=A0A9J6EI15_RHIMP|nr:hypothetical protein HPB51_018505 [Rhipicephalus microplus]
MDLLPKASSEFASEKYWNEFFNKRGKETFEWYGELWQHATAVFKYLKDPNDQILIIGCGNSTLSTDLYDCTSCKNITSIDISEVVIRQMNDKCGSLRPQMRFLQMDAAQMDFKDEEFTVILDKGLVDALTPDKDCPAKLYAVLKEVSRVLRVGGRFLCISLLQSHVLQALLKWFSSDPAWTWVIRFHRSEDAEPQDSSRLVLPIFVVVFIKLKRLLGLETVTEMAFDPQSKPKRVPASTLCEEVASLQQYAFLRLDISRRKLQKGEDVSLNLFVSWSDVPRYRLFVCDLQVPSQTQLRFAIFIVPQGSSVRSHRKAILCCRMSLVSPQWPPPRSFSKNKSGHILNSDLRYMIFHSYTYWCNREPERSVEDMSKFVADMLGVGESTVFKRVIFRSVERVGNGSDSPFRRMKRVVQLELARKSFVAIPSLRETVHACVRIMSNDTA